MRETLWLHYYCLKLIFLQAEIHHARVFSYFRGGTKFVRPLALEGAKEPSLLRFLVGFGGTSSQVGRFWVQTPPPPTKLPSVSVATTALIRDICAVVLAKMLTPDASRPFPSRLSGV